MMSATCSSSRPGPPTSGTPEGRGICDGYSLTAKAILAGHRLQAAAPPISVVDGLTGDVLCDVPASIAINGKSLKVAVKVACGLPFARQRLVWGGRGLADGILPSDLVRGGFRDVRLVHVEAPSWNQALDRCALTTDAGLIPPELRDDLWPTAGFPVTAADHELLHDRGFALALVQQSGGSLRLLPEPFREDREVVLVAVRETGIALVWASEELRSDREVVDAALGQDGRALEFAGAELRADPDVVLVAVQRHGEALQYALGEWCCLDRDLALAAVRQRSSALALAHFGLLKQRDFVLEAVKANGDALHHVPDCFRRDQELVLAAHAFWASKESYKTPALLPERALEFVANASVRAVDPNQEN